MYESRESSSPKLTRTINAALKSEHAECYQFVPIEKILLKIVGLFPQNLARWIIPRVQSPNALERKVVENLSLPDLINERLSDYKDLQGKYPAICIGVGMGGASGHLSVALDAPFLPQAFVLTLKKGSRKGDIQEYYEHSYNIAKIITNRYPEIISIQHFDPIHDGWLTRTVNHLRLKLIDLPDDYKQFIKRYLKPGGEIVYFEGKTQWLQYLIGEHNYFQVGGWGGITDREYIESSPRVRAFRKMNNLVEKEWCLPGKELIRGFESEWGSSPGLETALELFCKEENYHFTKISFENPHDFARLAFEAQKFLYKKNKIMPNGVFVEMFSQYDLTSAIEGGLLPVWLIYNTKDSLDFLETMAKDFPKGKPVFFSPLSTFSLTPDIVQFYEWENILKKYQWINIGARKSHYPADTTSLVKWAEPLRKWSEGKNNIIDQWLTGDDLDKMARSLYCDS
jgi:hypothetical protein